MLLSLALCTGMQWEVCLPWLLLHRYTDSFSPDIVFWDVVLVIGPQVLKVRYSGAYLEFLRLFYVAFGLMSCDIWIFEVFSLLWRVCVHV